MQVDIKVLKQLDRNLYAGEEVREVYKEIMKTVKTNHLDPSLVRPMNAPSTPLLSPSTHGSCSLRIGKRWRACRTSGWSRARSRSR